MKKIKHLLLRYPLSSILIIGIWVMCLIPVPETPLNEIRMIDKWTHLVFFGTLTIIIWLEYGFRHTRFNIRKGIVYGILAPIMMGGLIEIVQATCTGGNRSGDIYDFLADAIGVVAGLLIGIPLAIIVSKQKKDSSKG